ncbi:AAA family ATPase [Streptomyces sp. NPDC101225]|uniref:AAA family ATPase n=1 Tax=Streptomyces sp. NPDC101225 TaxID=3366135 RepID=UPI0037F2795B
MTAEESALVSAFEIHGLFGNRYLHVDLVGEGVERSKGRRLSLLYGNNGSGKTTALKLLWHALSPSDKEGHRNQIARTPFERFTIFLCRGDVITFVKTGGLVGDFTATVTKNEKKIVEQFYSALPDGTITAVGPRRESSQQDIHQQPLFEVESRDPRSHVGVIWEDLAADFQFEIQKSLRAFERQPDTFVKYLENLGTGPYMLADDRRIYGDDIERKNNRHRSRRVVVEADEGAGSSPASGVTAELAIAVQRAYDMIQKMIIDGNVSGSRGSNNVYLGILEKISQATPKEADRETRRRLGGNLRDIAKKTAEYSKYGLMPTIREESFLEVLNRTPDSRLDVAEDVLQPFLEAQVARLDALSHVARLLATLTREVDRFFESSGKRVRYRAPSGIRVLSEDGELLQLDNLSSGERQILLLLLNTVLARQSTRLFLIDEPELSLNVKWQRQLMGALLALTEGTPVQFIVATHSIEVITGHRDSLARVAPKKLEK